MGENYQKRDSDLATSVTTVGSFVKIDSISIDLEDAVDKYDGGKCDHFSIRGYVSEIRKKNWKMCWPFTLDSEENKFEEQPSLFQLDVPKSRWWNCANCRRRNSTDTAKECCTGFNSPSMGSRSNDNCSQLPSLGDTATIPPDFMPSLGDTATIRPDFWQDPKPNTVDVCTSTNGNISMHQSLICGEMKEVSVEDAHATLIGHEKALENGVGNEIPRLTENHSIVMQENHKCDAEPQNLEGGISADLSDHGGQRHEVTSSELDKHSCKISTKICQPESQICADDQQKQFKIVPGTSVLACLADKVGDVVKGQTHGHKPLLLDKSEDGSSESAENSTRNNLEDHSQDSSSSLHRKKTRKVRLLTELLFDNGDAKTGHIRTEDFPSNEINSGAAMVGAISVPQDQVSLQEISRLDLGENRKRKLAQEEEQRPLEMSSSNGINKKVKSFKEGEEIAIGVADSQLKETFSGLCSQTDTKRHWSKNTTDRNPTIGKKKNKKPQITDARPSLVPTGEKLQKQIPEKVGNSSNNGAGHGNSFRLTEDASIRRGNDQISLSVSRKDKKIYSCKKKGKMPQVENENTAQFTWDSGLLKKCQNEVVQNGAITLSFQRPEDSTTRLQSSLGRSVLASKRHDRKYTPQVGDGPYPLLPWLEGASANEIVKRDVEKNHVADSSFPSNSSYGFFKKREHGELSSKLPTYNVPALNEKQNNQSLVEERCYSIMKQVEGAPANEIVKRDVEKNHVANSSFPSNSSYGIFKKRVHEPSSKLPTHNMPASNEKQNNKSLVEEGCYSLMKQVDFSVAGSSQKANEIKEQSAFTGKHDEIPEKVSEPATLDDIPMEIVELMAKNQYERGLGNAESNNRPLETTRNGQMRDNAKVCCTEEVLLSDQSNQKRNSQARNGRKDIITARKNLGSTKQKSVDYFSHMSENHFDFSHLGQQQAPAEFGLYAQSQKKPSRTVQFPALGSGPCSCARNCKWNDNMVGQGFSQASMQIGACETCGRVSQPIEEAARHWSSVRPIQMPITYNIPQKDASRPTNLDILSASSGLLQRGNINREHEHRLLNLNASNLENHNQSFGSESLSGRRAEYLFAKNHNGLENKMGSLDLYSNETIPAMHLLSLMDAGMRSGGAFNVGGNSKLFRRACPPDHNSKEYSRLENGVYKPSDTVKHLSPEFYGKNHFSVNPAVGPSTSSFHHANGFERSNDFTSQVSFSSHRKEKVQSSNSAVKTRGRKPLKSKLPSDGFGTNHGAIAVHSMQKGLLGPSGSTALPLQHYVMENSMQNKVEKHHTSGTCWHPKSSFESSYCTINENPADFSVPEAGNVFMIRGQDLKFGKSRKRAGLTNMEQRKRQRNVKRTPEKECPKH